MSDKICTIVSLYKGGRLSQGYTLYGDRTKVRFRSRGFSIVVEMQDNIDEDRPQASVKVCGHEIFNTEDHVLKAPNTVVIDSLTALSKQVRGNVRMSVGIPTGYGVPKEARASVALDGQTQSAQED